MFVTIALAVIGSVHPIPVRAACTAMQPHILVTADTPSYVVLRATQDSVSDGLYYMSRAREGFRREPSFARQQPTEIFGQVFELVRVVGERADHVSRHKKVIVVWWGHGMQCQRAQPNPVRRVPSGLAFLHRAPRDPDKWIDGLPTYDMSADFDFAYAPDHMRWKDSDAPAPRANIPMQQFLDFFALLPSATAYQRDRERSLRPMLQWAAADTTRWELAPVRTWLCNAASFANDADGRRRCLPASMRKP